MGGSNLGISNGSCELEDTQRIQKTLILKQDGVVLLDLESSVLLRTSVTFSAMLMGYGINSMLEASGNWLCLQGERYLWWFERK